MTEDQCTGDEIEWNKKDKKCGRKSTVKKMTPADFVYLTQADPACDSEFKKLAKYMPNPGKFLKEYKNLINPHLHFCIYINTRIKDMLLSPSPSVRPV